MCRSLLEATMGIVLEATMGIARSLQGLWRDLFTQTGSAHPRLEGVVGAKKLLPGFSSRELVLNPDSTDLAQAARQPKQHQNQYYEPERRPPCIAPA